MIELRPATPAERLERDRLSFAEWCGGLSLADHLAREAELRDGAWARSCLTTWLLLEGGDVVASCEAYAVRSTVDGVPGTTYELASVFTEERLRGKGYASALVRQLSERYGALPDTQAMLLFSDVGESIYARLGFEGLPAWDRVAAPLEDCGDGEITELASPVSEPASGTGFALRPTVEQLGWHLDEARISARLAGKPNLASCGARVGAESGGGGTIVWALDPRTDELLVLDLEAEGAAAARLWARARHVAFAAGLSAVRAWETGDWPGELGERMEREGHIPMIRPFAAFDPTGFSRGVRGLWV